MNLTKNNRECDDRTKGNRNKECELGLGMETNSVLSSKRKLRLDMSFHKACSAPASPTGNLSYLDLTWDDDEGRSVKRKKEKTEEIQDGQQQSQASATMAAMMRRVIKRIDKETRSLMVMAKERNTKGEIKEIAGNLRTLTSQLMTLEAQELLQTLGRKADDGNPSLDPKVADKEVQTEDNTATTDTPKINELISETNKLRKENSLLKSKLQNYELTPRADVENRRKIEEALEAGKNIKEFLKIADIPWESYLFKNTSLKAGNSLAESKEADLAIVKENRQTPTPSAIFNMFTERYPELIKIATEKIGSCTAMANSCRVIGDGDAEED